MIFWRRIPAEGGGHLFHCSTVIAILPKPQLLRYPWPPVTALSSEKLIRTDLHKAEYG